MVCVGVCLVVVVVLGCVECIDVLFYVFFGVLRFMVVVSVLKFLFYEFDYGSLVRMNVIVLVVS